MGYLLNLCLMVFKGFLLVRIRYEFILEGITEALWGTKVSPGTINNLNKEAYEHIATWRSRPLTGQYPYVYVDGVYLKRS